MMLSSTDYVKIGRRHIGNNKPVFIIAEAGVNYNNKLSLAFKMIGNILFNPISNIWGPS